MAPPASTTSLVFSPGPLGFELEPLSEGRGRAIGCRVVGFKRGDDGRVGQAQRIGGVQPGDVLTRIGGVSVSEMTFDKIIALLQHNPTRTERHLTFQSSRPPPTTTTTTVAQTPTPAASTISRDQGQPLSSPPLSNGPKSHFLSTTITSTGGSTQPATPSPGSKPRPVGDSATRFVEKPESLVGAKGEDQLQRRRMGWAMGLLGLGGARAGEADGMTDLDAERPREGGFVVAGDVRRTESAGSRLWWTETQGEVGLSKRLEGGDTDSGTDGNSAITTAGAFCRAEPPTSGIRIAAATAATTGFDTAGSPGTPGAATKTSDTACHGGDVARPRHLFHDAPSLSSRAPSSSPAQLPVEQEQQHLSRSAAEPACSKASTTTVPPGDGVVTPSTIAGHPVTISTKAISRRLDRQRGHNIYNESGERSSSRDSSPETTGLDTVSLFSEPAASAKSASSKQRISVLGGFWGGGGGGRGSSAAAAHPGSEGEEGEAEAARRLARSLAVKLKERARRCEELEDLFGLRDHQVSMLQRQSNSLAARAASLADELSDKSALVEALQRDRSRLEQELARSRPKSPSDNNNEELHNSDVVDQPPGKPIEAEASDHVDGAGANLRFPWSGGDDSTGARRAADHVQEAPAMEAALAAGNLAAAVEEAEGKARSAIAAAEARSLALKEMVDSLVLDKVGWEEERAAGAAEALRLRARVRGLEEALVDREGDEGGERDGGVSGARKQESVVAGLRKLLRERTRELQVTSVATERLASHARELEEENRRLHVAISAREEDLLVSDRQMQLLTARLKGEARASGEAAAVAEAAAGHLRRALEEATRESTAGVGSGGGDGGGTEDKAGTHVGGEQSESGGRTGGGEEVSGGPPSLEERISWAEERARLHHNLLSLREALRNREVQAEAEAAAMTSRLNAAQDDRDWASRDRATLREAVDALRVELAEALVLATGKHGGREGVLVGGGGGRGVSLLASTTAAAAAAAAAAAGDEGADGSVADGGVDGSGGVDGAGDGDEELEGHVDGASRVVSAGEHLESSREKESESSVGEESARERNGGGWDDGGENSEVTSAGRNEEAETDRGDRRDGLGGDGGASNAAAAGDRGRWPDCGFEGSIDDVQLDLMEKDIVIEQLRTQLKQLRWRMAVMEEEQAADTAPLQGLLNQLGELKGSVEEREEREQQCRDQVDMGLLRMERLKEESATAAGVAAAASPPASFTGSMGASPTVLAQAKASHGQAQADQQQQKHQQQQQQRLRRQLEDLQWDVRTLKRRIEERDNQIRDARSEAESLKVRCRSAERDLGGVQSERAMAMAEAAAERRRTSALRAELQSLRAELQAVRERAASAAAAAKISAEEERRRIEADGRDRVFAAVTAVEAAARERAAALSASLRTATTERDQLLAAKRAEQAAAAGRSVSREAEDGEARAREVESMRCALAARDVELESIVDATAGFGHHAGSLGGGVGGSGSGGGALRGALAAATEARRAGRLVAELREESSLLTAKVKEERAEAHRLREALEQAKVAEEKMAAAVTAAAAASRTSARESQGDHSKGEEEGCSATEARETKKRVQEAEDSLQRALAGAHRAFIVVSSCLADESTLDDGDLFGAVTTAAASAATASVPPWQLQQKQPAAASPSPSVDPSLRTLVSGAESLAAAYRNRGHALRRATVAVRAKSICAREARRREETEARARGDVEGRLDEALVALDACRQDHLHQHQKQQQQQAARWDVVQAGGRVAGISGPGDVSGGARSSLSHEQEEHLRQIRSEVDRLESQNQTLRRSLEGGDSDRRLLAVTTTFRSGGRERRGSEGFGGDRDGRAPTQRLLCPPSSAAGGINVEQAGQRSNSHEDCWERAEALSESSGRASSRTPSLSPVRSWTAVSNVRGRSPWPPRRDGNVDGGSGGQEQGCRRDDFDEGGDERGKDDARARVLEECAGYCVPPQEDGSGGTLVPTWGTDH